MNSYKFTVYGEPKGKARPIVTRTGHAFTPKNTVLYENLVKTSFIETVKNFEVLSGQLECQIDAYFGIPKSVSKKKKQLMLDRTLRPVKKPDLDNITKIVLDSLNGIAFVDDSHVVSALVNKYYSENPRVEIMINQIYEE